MNGWTVADIDAAIPIIRAKRDRDRAAGKHLQADIHQKWIDRLLDHRPLHVMREGER